MLLAISCTIVSIQSCKKDDLCEERICENGGIETENGCECDCPDGYIGSNCENLDPAQVQVFLDGGQTPLELLNGNVPLDSLYGKTYEGGFIFYLNTDDGTGMVATTEDQSTGAVWGCFAEEITGANGVFLGTGAQNTMDILSGCTESGIAARICADLILNDKEDWFLPSNAELGFMYTNLHLKGHGGFADDWYWSSSEIGNSLGVWCQSFNSGDRGEGSKDVNFHVRAARAF